MRRREFFAVLGGTAAWPLAAEGQQRIKPVIGYFDGGLPETHGDLAIPFRQGLEKVGFSEGQNVTIEYRWAGGRIDELPALVSELVRREVHVIVAVSSALALAAKAATPTIPIIFVTGSDPVRIGLVSSFNRPGGNLSGFYIYTRLLEAKRLELVRELVPSARTIAFLANQSAPNVKSEVSDLEEAARSVGQQVRVAYANNDAEISRAFVSVAENQVHALLIGSGPFFASRRSQIVALAAKYSLPTIYPFRNYVEDGGLCSYAPDISDVRRQMGVYAGRVLKGEKPADLPVIQPTKLDLTINLKAAKEISLTIPAAIIARADEVIE